MRLRVRIGLAAQPALDLRRPSCVFGQRGADMDPALPPLPPGPPPPAVTAATPAPPPPASGGVGWPPISDLLIREAHAWAGLLGLHGGVVHAARQLAGHADDAGDAVAVGRAASDAAQAREQAYCAALTSLAAQCDGLATEALRLRNLRKARCTAEASAAEAIIQHHTQEALAVGSALATNSALSVQTATTEIRQAMQSTKTQIAQLRALLEAATQSEASAALRGQLRVSVQRPDGAEQALAVDAVLAAVYRHSPELNEASLTRALAELVEGNDAASPAAAPPVRSFARRMGSDRSGTPR